MIRLALLLLLLAAPAAAQQPICICLKCATGAYRSFWAPAGSMKPAIVPGQCFVGRTRYSASDLTPGTVITFRHPVSGIEFVKRIVATGGQSVQMRDGRLHIDGTPVPVTENGIFEEVFGHQGPQRLLPRCANGPVGLGQTCLKTRLTERLGDRSYDILDIGTMALDNTGEFQVPPDHLFVLGDNRDNSVDSRVRQSAGGVGFVHIEDVTSIVEDH